MTVARLQLRMFEAQLMVCALALARESAGSSNAASMAMMAMTTNSSMSVNARRRRLGRGLASPLVGGRVGAGGGPGGDRSRRQANRWADPDAHGRLRGAVQRGNPCQARS